MSKKWALFLFPPKWVLSLFPLFSIVIIGFLAYSNTFRAPFHFDDALYIVENRYIHLNELTLSKLFDAAVKQRPTVLITTVKGRYSKRPVSNLSFALNYYFGGLNVFGYHLVNLFIHILAGIILYLLLVTTLNSGPLKGKYKKREWLALIIALLWVVYPVQTESVTYIGQRMTSMAGMFFLLSLYLYARGRLGETRGDRVWYYSGSFVAGILALGIKETAGVLPLMLVIYEFYFFSSLDSRVIRERWLWIVGILVIFLIVGLTYLGPNLIGGILTAYQYKGFTLGERLLTQLRVVMYYLSLLVFPSPSRLNVDYDFPLSHSLFDPVSTLFCLVGLIGLVGLGIYLARRRPLASFGIFWFLGNLVVESSVIPLEIIFEHRLYLPLLGFLLFFAEITGRKADRREFIYGAFAIILIFAFWTLQRNTVWKDEIALWADCVKKSPDKAKTHNSLGVAYALRGASDDAIREYRKALEIKPDFAEAYYALGSAYYDKRMLDDAIREYRKALEIKPDLVEAHNDLGNAYRDKGMLDEATREFQQALWLLPDFAKAIYNLGNVYADKGMLDEAIREFQRALEIEPGFFGARVNLGIIYSKRKMFDDAIREYQQALRLKPDCAEAFYNLGVVYYFREQYDLSGRCIEAAGKLGFPIPLEFVEMVQKDLIERESKNTNDQ